MKARKLPPKRVQEPEDVEHFERSAMFKAGEYKDPHKLVSPYIEALHQFDEKPAQLRAYIKTQWFLHFAEELPEKVRTETAKMYLGYWLQKRGYDEAGLDVPQRVRSRLNYWTGFKTLEWPRPLNDTPGFAWRDGVAYKKLPPKRTPEPAVSAQKKLPPPRKVIKALPPRKVQ